MSQSVVVALVARSILSQAQLKHSSQVIVTVELTKLYEESARFVLGHEAFRK